jgi:integrase
MHCKIPDCTGPFKDVIPAFIEFKRSLGYDYGRVDCYRLREIDLFFKEHGVTEVAISEEMFELWNMPRPQESKCNQRKRANKLIGLAKYLRSCGYGDIFIGELPRAATRIPPNPHVFTKSEIVRIFNVAKADAAARPKRRDCAAFAAMFAMYYCCGLRKSEVQNLRMKDVDFDTGCIRIMDSKNHVSRMVVASDSLKDLLESYRVSHRIFAGMDEYLFRGEKAEYFPDYALYKMYRHALLRAGIKPRENGRLPRLHDLRHTFCVHALEGMGAKGFDLYVSLPLLVKHLGHQCISETEYYLRLVEENFTSVTSKIKDYAPSLFPKAGGPYE